MPKLLPDNTNAVEVRMLPAYIPCTLGCDDQHPSACPFVLLGQFHLIRRQVSLLFFTKLTPRPHLLHFCPTTALTSFSRTALKTRHLVSSMAWRVFMCTRRIFLYPRWPGGCSCALGGSSCILDGLAGVHVQSEALQLRYCTVIISTRIFLRAAHFHDIW